MFLALTWVFIKSIDFCCALDPRNTLRIMRSSCLSLSLLALATGCTAYMSAMPMHGRTTRAGKGAVIQVLFPNTKFANLNRESFFQIRVRALQPSS